MILKILYFNLTRQKYLSIFVDKSLQFKLKYMTAEDSLKKLQEGNTQYLMDKEQVGTGEQVRRALVSGQSPYAIILSCADSRVIPESIFDANAGELFVCRVAGNIANTSTIASIEYAVAHIGTKLIVVLGHQSCGAVTAALTGGDNGHNLNHLCAHITPAIHASESSEVNDVVKVNAEMNSKALGERSQIINDALNKGLKIVPAYYNLDSGKVDFL